MTDPSAAPAATAARAMLGALVRKLLAIAGTALVTRGFLDRDTADGAIPIIAEQLVGFLVVAVATWWSIARARLSHSRWAAAWKALWGDQTPVPTDPGGTPPALLALAIAPLLAFAIVPCAARAQSPIVGKPITGGAFSGFIVVYCDDGTGHVALCPFGGGGGDASAANQAQQLAVEQAIRDRIGALTSPAAGSTNYILTGIQQLLGGTLTVGTHAVTQSGTWTVNIGTIAGLATAAKQDALVAALGTPFQANGAISNTFFGARLQDASGAAFGTAGNPIVTAPACPTSGTTGGTAPACATEIGGVGPSGNLRAVCTDTGGRLCPAQFQSLDSSAVAIVANAAAVQIDTDVQGAGSTTAMTTAQRGARVLFVVQVVSGSATTAPVYICYGGQGSSCNATYYSAKLPSGSADATVWTSPGGYPVAVYAYSTAAVTLKLSSQVPF